MAEARRPTRSPTRAMSSMSPSGKAPQHPAMVHAAPGHGRGATVSELCTLAPWDELAAFRKHVELRFEEVLAVAHERREGETKTARTCQQVEAKVEKFARQTRGLHSRSEVFESHLTGQAKELDSCRELNEALRDKVQRMVLDWTSSLNAGINSLRTEVEETVELRHESVLETCHRGDRAIADELLKKMGELNEKLGANMVSLEGELAGDFKKFRSELERQDKEHLESLATSQAAVAQRLAQVHGEMAEAHDRLQSENNEHAGRLGDVEAKLAKLLENVSRMDGHMSVVEQATANKFEQLKELIDETTEQTAASFVRVRSEAESTTRDAVRASREEMREDMRTVREELSKDLRGGREDLRANLSGCRELLQNAQQEAMTGVAEVKGEFRTLCRDVFGMVEEVQQQVANAHTETQTSGQKLEQEVEARLSDITKHLTAVHEELHEHSTGANDQLVTLTETLSGTQQRLAEVCASSSRMQSSMEEMGAGLHRCQTFAESAMAEVRRDSADSAEHLEGTAKRQLKEARDEWQRQLEAAHSEGLHRVAQVHKDAEDAMHRLARVERAGETQVSELREQLRERLRENAHDWAKLHSESQGIMEERLQALARQSDSGLASLRGELTNAATAVRESRAESERACHRIVEEVVHNQEAAVAEALAAEKEATGTVLAEFHRELHAVHGIVAEQGSEALALKQSVARAEDLKHMMEELEVKFEEQLNALSANTRYSLQESRQEVRQFVARQLEERMQPWSDKLAETASDLKAAKRSEKSACERFQKTCTEVVATQDSLAQQCSATAQEIAELRAELHGEAKVRPGDALRRGLTPRERSTEHRSAFRDEFQLRSEVQGFQSEAPLRSSAKFDTEAPPRLGAKLYGGDDPARLPRALSQDRWSFSAPSRPKPRSTFEAVLGASPLCTREGETFARRSRTPSPTPASALGGRPEESWTFGTRSQETHQWKSDPLGSPHGLRLGGRSSLPTVISPPRSPRSLSLRSARGSYI